MLHKRYGAVWLNMAAAGCIRLYVMKRKGMSSLRIDWTKESVSGVWRAEFTSLRQRCLLLDLL